MVERYKKLKTPNYRTLLSIAISLLFAGYILLNRHSIFGPLKDIAFGYILLVVLGQLGIILFNALLLKSTLRPLKTEVGLFESIKLISVASFVNFFTPVVGGASVRAVYLKRKYSLPYSSFISVMYANYLIIFFVSFIIGLLGLALIGNITDPGVGRVMATIFLIGAGGSALFMVWGHKITQLLIAVSFRNNYMKKIVEKIKCVDEGWAKLRTNPQAIIGMTFWSLMAQLSIAIALWAAMKSVHVEPSTGSALVFAALAVVGLLVNITPGGVGIIESVYASIYSITSISPKQVVSFSLVYRPVQLLVLGLAWVLFSKKIISDVPMNKLK